MSTPMIDKTTPRLQMFDIHKRFGATVALDGVDLSVDPGTVHALVGENGAGKSTLMKVLSGAISADTGTMLLDGEAYQPRGPLHARMTGVTMIYQELSLAPHLSVEENIVLGVEPARRGVIRWKNVRQTARAALAQLGHPEIDPGVLVSRLPVGAQQIIEIGRAIAVGSRVLVLDEPTSSLTRGDVERLFDLIRNLKADGHAIVYISHFIEEVKEIADEFTVLRDGQTVGGGPTASTTPDEIVTMMVGRHVEDLYPHTARDVGEPVLEIESLAGMIKPTDASLTLHTGEVVGIAGLVGAGRTELLRALFGLDQIRSGNVCVGAYVGPASPARRWAEGVGLLSEDRKEEGLALSLSIADNTTLSNLSGFGPLRLVLPRRQEAATREYIERLQIKCKGPRQAVSNLSGGNQQKVALARLLQHDVDILLLDEPTRGIDVGSKALIYKLIDGLATVRGGGGGKPKAILIVSSYLPELLGMCDRVAVMCRGKLGSARPVSELDEHKVMLEATGTEAAG